MEKPSDTGSTPSGTNQNSGLRCCGPTCDSVDVLYEKAPVMLPLSLREGDRIVFGSAGAYTTSYSTVGFNGFAPLPTICRARAQGDLSR